ncbi:MAG: hypothetical protein ACRYHA_20125, partial [Janthinobacterium lividum]
MTRVARMVRRRHDTSVVSCQRCVRAAVVFMRLDVRTGNTAFYQAFLRNIGISERVKNSNDGLCHDNVFLLGI